jgi:hypothetical protein
MERVEGILALGIEAPRTRRTHAGAGGAGISDGCHDRYSDARLTFNSSHAA